MPRSLISHGTWLVLASLTACIAAQEDSVATEPPPVVGNGQKPSAAQSTPASGSGATSSSSAGTGPRATTGTAADGGVLSQPGAGMTDEDAGPLLAAGSSAAGRGGSSAGPAAGSGGRTGADGRAGSGGVGGGRADTASNACMDQLCFTVVDCWLLSPEQCNYVACDNFVCR